jgi:hypothetical protein
MSLDLGHSQSLLWIILQHGRDQVNEILTEESFTAWLVSRVCFPENFKLVDANEFIVRIIRDGLGEGWMLGDHDEENYT